jgi:hypothetical protein
MSDSMMDRRKAPRYPLTLVVEVTDGVSSVKFTARTSDVSRTGCYIDLLNPLPHGSKLRLRLQNGRESFESEATVKYVSPGLGMGVEFKDDLPAERLALLNRWLANASKVSV